MQRSVTAGIVLDMGLRYGNIDWTPLDAFPLYHRYSYLDPRLVDFPSKKTAVAAIGAMSNRSTTDEGEGGRGMNYLYWGPTSPARAIGSFQRARV